MKVAGTQVLQVATGINLTGMSDQELTCYREIGDITLTFDQTRFVVDGDAADGNLKVVLLVSDFPAGYGGTWKVSGWVEFSAGAIHYPLQTAILPIEEEYEP